MDELTEQLEALERLVKKSCEEMKLITELTEKYKDNKIVADMLLNKKIEGYINIDTNTESIDQINTLIFEHAENCIISNQNGIKFN